MPFYILSRRWKAPTPIVVTDGGIVILDNRLFSNAYSSMVVTEGGIVTSVKLLCANVYPSMVVREEGDSNVTLVN